MNKEKTAKLIRIITVPPIMVTVLLLILYFNKREIFSKESDMIIMLIFLGIFPVLAYPLQKIIPKFRREGRNGQRKLAFVTNVMHL